MLPNDVILHKWQAKCTYAFTIQTQDLSYTGYTDQMITPGSKVGTFPKCYILGKHYNGQARYVRMHTHTRTHTHAHTHTHTHTLELELNLKPDILG